MVADDSRAQTLMGEVCCINAPCTAVIFSSLASLLILHFHDLTKTETQVTPQGKSQAEGKSRGIHTALPADTLLCAHTASRHGPRDTAARLGSCVAFLIRQMPPRGLDLELNNGNNGCFRQVLARGGPHEDFRTCCWPASLARSPTCTVMTTTT